MKKILLMLLIVFSIFTIGCNTKLPNPNTNLEYWICDNVDNVNWENHQEKYGLFGGSEYYGLGYTPTIGKDNEQIDPEYCVIYTVTKYPDYSSKNSHITRIVITDPNIEFYGISLNSSFEEIKDVMKDIGFEIEENESIIRASKDKFLFKFTNTRIIISVGVTNKLGIIF